ncbi:MAG: T9SS type A sorting domain-containing protein [Ignavibacteriae bacterium]|nr:T9SS type A sorting domain-containing protein [Ignavibacteriota bacterium]
MTRSIYTIPAATPAILQQSPRSESSPSSRISVTSGTLLAFFSLLVLLLHGASPATAQTRLLRAVISSGAAAAGNGTTRLAGSVGQTLAGPTSSATERANFGFWPGLSGVPLAVERVDAVPASLTLGQNFPNPARGRTRITFSLDVPRSVRVVLYDESGREVMRLADGFFSAGSYSADLDVGTLSTGVYTYRFDAAPYALSRRLVVLH